MREYFASDENKRYSERSSWRENAHAEEVFRCEEVYRSPETRSDEGAERPQKSTPQRKRRTFTDRLLAGGVAPVACTVAGGAVIAVAVVVMAIRITLLAAVVTMTGISLDFRIENVGDYSLTLYLSGGGYEGEIPLTSKDDTYSVSFSGLMPDTDYLATICDQTGKVHYSKTYTTLPYEPSLVPVETGVSPEMIFLQFNSDDLPDLFNVYVNQTPYRGDFTKDYPVLQLEGLSLETDYEIRITDVDTGDWLYYETFTTPYISLYDVSVMPYQTMISHTVTAEVPEGHYATVRLVGDGYDNEYNIGGYYEPMSEFVGLQPDTRYVLTVEDDRGNVIYEQEIYTLPVRQSLTATVTESSFDTLQLQFAGEALENTYYEVYLDGELCDTLMSGEDGIVVLEGLTRDTTYEVAIRDTYTMDYMFVGQFSTPAVIFTFTERQAGETELMLFYTLDNPDLREIILVVSSDGQEVGRATSAEDGELLAYIAVDDTHAEYELEVFLDDGSLLYSTVLPQISTA